MWGTAVKYSIALCAAGIARKKGTFDPIWNLKCFIQAVNFRWPTQKLLWPPQFSFILLWLLRNLVWAPGGGWDMAHVEEQSDKSTHPYVFLAVLQLCTFPAFDSVTAKRPNGSRFEGSRAWVQLISDGTRWRTGEEVKGKKANGVGSQYSSTLPRNVVYPELLKVNVKWFRYRPGVAQRVGRGIALHFHDRGTSRGWVVSSTPRSHFTPRKDPVPILQEAGWATGSVWTGGKSRPTAPGFDPRTVQPVVSRYTDWATRTTPAIVSTFKIEDVLQWSDGRQFNNTCRVERYKRRWCCVFSALRVSAFT